jgi:hypothetical protein
VVVVLAPSTVVVVEVEEEPSTVVVEPSDVASCAEESSSELHATRLPPVHRSTTAAVRRPIIVSCMGAHVRHPIQRWHCRSMSDG